MTVGELLSRVSSAELTEWMAFDLVDPFGAERADLRAGIVASTIANVNRGKGKKAYSPKDFMPDYRPKGTRLAAKARAALAAAAAGAEAKRQRKVK